MQSNVLVYGLCSVLSDLVIFYLFFSQRCACCVSWSFDVFYILGMFPKGPPPHVTKYLTPHKCNNKINNKCMVTHNRNWCSALNTHCEHAPGAVGSHCSSARGAIGGSGALVKGTSVMVLKVERVLFIHNPHLQSLPDLRFEPTTFGLQV